MGERRTTCPYCGVGCGIIARREENGAVSVRGDPDHPANFGKLCSKGSALAETLSLDERFAETESDVSPRVRARVEKARERQPALRDAV